MDKHYQPKTSTFSIQKKFTRLIWLV